MHKISLKDSACAFVKNTYRHLPLLGHMIKRDVKRQYRGSFLGYVWSILNPLLTMTVMWIVFSNLFGNREVENFPVYLFIGQMFFSFVVSATNAGMRSITGNADLLTKTPVPKYIFPIANITSAAVTFLFSLGAFLIVLLVTRTQINFSVLFFPVVVIQAYLFSLGLGFILATGNVFFRDISHLYGVFTTAWMYFTPIFYVLEDLPWEMQFLVSNLNPAYYFIKQSRMIFLEGLMPTTGLILKGFGSAFVMVLIGLLIFRKTQDKFILHI
ncbi:MAG: ABC transporter permease [Clostridiales bacterium]|nr:ABC transporter permease [Clostridiales bacterium]